MSDWKLAMLLILPFMVWQAKFAMVRTWAALMANSLLAGLFPFVAAYIFIDGIAAWAVLRRPMGLAQRAIGLLFAGMVLTHVGFLLSPQASGLLHWQVNMLIGWLQFGCLFAWGAFNVVEFVAGRMRSGARALDRTGGV